MEMGCHGTTWLPYSQGKTPHYTHNRRQGRHNNRSEKCGEKKIPCRKSNHDSPVTQFIIIIIIVLVVIIIKMIIKLLFLSVDEIYC
jgi:hypothetical protein